VYHLSEVFWYAPGMGKKPLTVALYARVSTTDQRCTIQLAELNRYADARGWTVYQEYLDKGVSGKTNERPAMKRCLADAKAHRFSAILVVCVMQNADYPECAERG
jgi:DNA invertase Pin-like site-specific DNA recombinase